jgi:hypothetical protein
MNRTILLIAVVITVFLSACNELNHPQVTLQGQFFEGSDSVSVDGIELRVRAINPADGFRGTAYVETLTDSTGNFESKFRVPLPGLYPIEISKDGEPIAEILTVLADGETVNLTVGFPISDSTVTLSSPENDLYTTLNRVDRNYRRVATFLQAGVLSEDSTRMEIEKWSTLYWDFYQENSSSVAGQLAAASSVQLLRGLDDSLMVERIFWSLERDVAMIPGGVLLLTDYELSRGEAARASDHIRKILRTPQHEEHKRTLYQILTRLEYERNEMKRGLQLLHQMSRDLPVDPVTRDWITLWRPEFTDMARGEVIPDFQIWSNGTVLNQDSLKGRPYLLEFTRLANRRYQDQLDQLSVIYQLFSQTGLEVVTVAQDITPLRKETFFEEWGPMWVYADSIAGDWPSWIDTFNLNELPTRILVDADGRIYRKYQPSEFNLLLQGIQEVTQGLQESTQEDLDAMPSTESSINEEE